MALWLGGRGFGVEREEQQSEIKKIYIYSFKEKYVVSKKKELYG